MGIPGLLEHLKSVITRSHVSDFKGKSVAIDAHCWLHRGAFACSKELVLGTPTEKYIAFFMNMIKLFKTNGVTSILVVFDGLPLPNKSETNKRRGEDRRKNIELARTAEASGDQALAMTYYQRSVSVTFDMIKKLLAVLSKEGVPYMISPYESDAQLAFLSKASFVDLIITEDSDSIPYGCSAVLFKLDKEGYGDLFEQNKLHTNQSLSFASWTEDQFKLFCCLAGCDYMPGLRNFGIKTAHKVVQKHKTLPRVLDHLLRGAATSFEGCLATRLEQALLTFKHQTIYNPETRQTEPLTPLPLHLTYLSNKEVSAVSATGVRGSVQRSTLHPSEGELAFLGPLLDPLVAAQLVRGELDPRAIQDAAGGASTVVSTVEGAGSTSSNTAKLTRNTTLPTTLHSLPGTPPSTLPPRTPVRGAAPSQSQGPAIRWMSSEDRALHTSHALRRSADTTTAANSTYPTSTATNTNDNTIYTNNATTTGRKRQRTTHTTHNTHTSTQGQAGTISRGAALHAASVYSSDLVSDSLLPLHRRTRLRTVEPVYGSVGNSGGGSGVDASCGASSSGEVWDDTPTDTARYQGYSTTTNANTTTTKQRTSFFDDLPSISPVHTTDAYLDTSTSTDTYIADYIPPHYTTDDTTINTPNVYTTTHTPYNTDTYNTDIVADSLESHTDDAYCDTGLPQFQDALFEARVAHKYTLYDTVDRGGTGSVAGGSSCAGVRSGIDTYALGSVTCGTGSASNGRLYTPSYHTNPYNHYTSQPSVPVRGIWPADTTPATTTTSCPVRQLHTAYSNHHHTYPLDAYTDRYTTHTAYPSVHAYISGGMTAAQHYTPDFSTDTHYPDSYPTITARYDRNPILHDLGATEDRWRRQLFPGLQLQH